MNSLNFVGPINNQTGYGITSTNILKSLSTQGVDISLFPMGGVSVDNKADSQFIQGLAQKTTHTWNTEAPCFKIWHPHDLASSVGKGKYGALIFFELDRLKVAEVPMVNKLDTVFVSSQWAVDVLKNSGITTNIVKAPLAVNTEIFKDYGQPITFKNDSYKFINIGKWEIRKGHDFLLEAFNNAFNKEDKVELFMINQNPFLSQQENNIWSKTYKDSKLGEKINILPRVNTHVDLAKVIRDMDCGIFPARAEGWNNEILEVMALNKPIITTNYSAHTEYCTKHNSFLIDVDGLTNADDGKFFNNEGQWANLGKNQMDQTVEHLQKVYKDNIKSNPSGLETIKKYTWDNTASIIKTEMLNV